MKEKQGKGKGLKMTEILISFWSNSYYFPYSRSLSDPEGSSGNATMLD